MYGVNKVTLIGRVGKDPETKFLENGVAVTTFSLATSESYKNKTGEKVTNTEWHNIVLWRGLAEVASKYVKKGSSLYIEGKITTRSWEDKDGNKRSSTDIIGNNMVMLDSKGTGTSTNNFENGDGITPVDQVPQEEGITPPPLENEPDDLPF